MDDRYAEVQTVMGLFRVAFRSSGITMIHPAGNGRKEFEDAYNRRFSRTVRPGGIPLRYRRAVRQAAAGRAAPDVPLDLSGLTDFQQKVLGALRSIPRGEVRTYRWLARRAGRPRAVRAAGNVMARNPIPFILPCHRVVPSAGGIGNYGLGRRMKRDLLIREGAPVDEKYRVRLSGTWI
jgi:O-6-methylguanine DNA methyltransferase